MSLGEVPETFGRLVNDPVDTKILVDPSRTGLAGTRLAVEVASA